MSVWLVKWKSDGLYMDGELNWGTQSKAYRFTSKTLALQVAAEQGNACQVVRLKQKKSIYDMLNNAEPWYF